jgi:hypothetical protein
MTGVLPWLVRWACRAGTRHFGPALAALVAPEPNIFFLTVHYFNSFVPIAQQAGQVVVPVVLLERKKERKKERKIIYFLNAAHINIISKGNCI